MCAHCRSFVAAFPGRRRRHLRRGRDERLLRRPVLGHPAARRERQRDPGRDPAQPGVRHPARPRRGPARPRTATWPPATRRSPTRSINDFFNDASFGVPSDQVASTVQPGGRGDVTIARDKKTGVPHITGTTRYGTEYGAGYAAAQDRLWLMDVFRHVGRGQLTVFAGGAPANQGLEQEFWRSAPYTEADLQAQIDDATSGAGARGAAGPRRREGVHRRHQRLHRRLRQRPLLPRRVRPDRAQGRHHQRRHHRPLQAHRPDRAGLRHRRALRLRGRRRGATTPCRCSPRSHAVRRRRGHRGLGVLPRAQRPGGRPDRPRRQQLPLRAASRPPRRARRCPTPARSPRSRWSTTATGSAATARATGASAAAATTSLGSARRGHVQRPGGQRQAHRRAATRSPSSARRPATSRRSCSCSRSSRARASAPAAPPSRAWACTWSSAAARTTPGARRRPARTSSTPTPSSCARTTTHYLYHGTCTAMEKLERTNSWKPTLADCTAAGSYRMQVYRTKYGPVAYRATVGGKNVAYTTLRSLLPARGRLDHRLPDAQRPGLRARRPAAFQSATQHINYTFNWFYADSAHTAYYNSGDNPVRAAGVDAEFPVWAQAAYDWRGWDPAANTAAYTPPSAAPATPSTRTTTSPGTTSRPRTTRPAALGQRLGAPRRPAGRPGREAGRRRRGDPGRAGQGDGRRRPHRPARRGRAARTC